MRVWSLGGEDPLEEGMETYSSILAWELHRQRSWQATVHRVTKSWMWLKQLSMHVRIQCLQWSQVGIVHRYLAEAIQILFKSRLQMNSYGSSSKEHPPPSFSPPHLPDHSNMEKQATTRKNEQNNQLSKQTHKGRR